MAIEAKRGCGFRKVGGIYLRGTGDGVPCDRLPLALTVCPCCSHGFKQSRGWTWVDVNLLVQGVHRNCCDDFPCPLCMATSEMGRAGLLWIGEKFYPTPADFMREAAELGAKDEAYMADLAKRQLTPVVVPDDDRDHQGSVYDKEAADDSGTL